MAESIAIKSNAKLLPINIAMAVILKAQKHRHGDKSCNYGRKNNKF